MHRFAGFVFGDLSCCAGFHGPAAPGPDPLGCRPGGPSAVQPGPPSRMSASYVKMPLYFCPNGGQWDRRVAFSVQGKEKTLYFTPEGVTFVLAKPGQDQENSSPLDSPRPLKRI